MLSWLHYTDDMKLRSLFGDLWFQGGFAGVIKVFTAQ